MPGINSSPAFLLSARKGLMPLHRMEVPVANLYYDYYDGSRGGFYSQEAADAIFTGAMTRLYGWIALGAVTTGAVWLDQPPGRHPGEHPRKLRDDRGISWCWEYGWPLYLA